MEEGDQVVAIAKLPEKEDEPVNGGPVEPLSGEPPLGGEPTDS